MKRTALILMLGFNLIYFGCSNETALEMPDENEETPDCTPQFPEMDVTYDNYVKGIVDKYCISCHYAGNSPGPGNFTSYSGVAAYSDFFATRVIGDNADMPQGNAPLPQAVRDSLNVWIQNCAPKN
ncbi:hypothetical protein [Sunxiuqinia indica]|uniref:hypothetical protein n=1 Tax=Sunxiuqinia indica TaxID=2692584 RepID=UPI00135ADA7A|nr:hypothetical protein [Sunxiuqinia indica]